MLIWLFYRGYTSIGVDTDVDMAPLQAVYKYRYRCRCRYMAFQVFICEFLYEGPALGSLYEEC